MKNRREFTIKIVGLINEMFSTGESPIIDFVLRSAEEQNRLFKAGKSQRDGYKKISAHQTGKAMDLYFINPDGSFDWNPEKYIKWHSVWEKKYGGAKAISWDLGHWE